MITITITLPDAVRDAAGRQHKSVERLIEQIVNAYLEELDDSALVADFEAREAAGVTRVRDFAAFAAEMDDADASA